MRGRYPGSTLRMPARVPLSRRLSTASRWPLGVALTSWRYMWRTLPMHRSEVEGSLAEDGPPDLPGHVRLDEVLHPPGGAGPLFHRRYRGRIREADMGARELIDTISSDLDLVAPREFASFTKVRGEKGGMTVGDEYVVRMPGPWDGPVRVIEKTPQSFRFVTLEGHLEAGQIRFEARDAELLEFTHRVVGARGRPALQPPVRAPADEQGDPAAHVDVGHPARRRAVRRPPHRRHRDPHASCRSGLSAGCARCAAGD